MIVKHAKAEGTSRDPRIIAGEKAERQMAFYLHRAFQNESTVRVLNDLRLVDPLQPEYNGDPGVCQIDHLVLHRWGAFVIESKSVSDAVRITRDGTGGDEWRRVFGRREEGMVSPIKQAERQSEFLRKFLQPHAERLLEKKPLLIRTLSKLVTGSSYWSFEAMPIQIVIAVSGSGSIRRERGWKEPSKPFQTFVCKADQVTSKMEAEIAEHRSLFNDKKDNSNYGTWWISEQALERTGQFLCKSHTPRHAPAAAIETPPPARVPARPQPAPAAPVSPSVTKLAPPSPAAAASPAFQPSRLTPQAAVCKSCGGSDLLGNWGQYGYYWKCSCGTNTQMPVICHNCNAEGHRGQTVRIRKEGPKFFRCCDSCGVQQLIWTNPASPERQ